MRLQPLASIRQDIFGYTSRLPITSATSLVNLLANITFSKSLHQWQPCLLRRCHCFSSYYPSYISNFTSWWLWMHHGLQWFPRIFKFISKAKDVYSRTALKNISKKPSIMYHEVNQVFKNATDRLLDNSPRYAQDQLQLLFKILQGMLKDLLHMVSSTVLQSYQFTILGSNFQLLIHMTSNQKNHLGVFHNCLQRMIL